MSVILFGRYFKYTFTSIIIIELISLLSFVFPPLVPVAFLFIIGVAIALGHKKLEYLIYICLAELFIGGKGHLLVVDFYGIDLSIRMALFLILFMTWLFKFKKYPLGLKNNLLVPYLILAIFVIIGVLNGAINNELKNLFFDSNAWLYFILILPFLATIKTPEVSHNIFQIFGGSTTFLALKTIGTLVLFSHYVTGIGGIYYQWIRNTGVGEITYVAGSIFRVFFQSQIYVMAGLLLAITIMLTIKNTRDKNFWYLLGYIYLTSLALLISQSRSYWVGLAGGLLAMLIFSWWLFNFKIKETLSFLGLLIIIIVSQLFIINIITGNFDNNIVGERFKDLQSEPAGLSRINQLRPLTNEIIHRFLLGYGFGKTVTYQSSDPRILAQNSSGNYTTFAFEWGYLDIMLKIGVLGLMAYIFLLFKISYLGFEQIKKNKIMVTGTMIGLIAILATNIFSPYLNHPLGIGYLILLSSLYSIKS